MDTVDVRPPLLSIYSDCGNCIITATDNRKFPLNKDSFQLDAGIRDVPVLLKSRSRNFDDIIIDPKYTKDSIYYEMIFELKVKNKFDTAFAVFFIYDNANNQNKNNVKYDSVKYYPQLISIDNDKLNYGAVYLDSVVTKQITIKNVAGFDYLLKDIRLKKGDYYKITNNIKKNYNFIDASTITLNIEYNPTVEISSLYNYDLDTLIIKNECLTYLIPLQGQGVVPRIVAEDFDFGICEVGKSLCKDKSNFPDSYDGLNISNIGTGNLIINNYRFDPAITPYKLINPEPQLKSSLIFPYSSINVKSLCFAPDSPGEFFAKLIFSNNSKGPDSIANLRGIAYNRGPYFKSLNFGELRVMDKSKKFISLKNSDSKPYYLYDLSISDQSSGFRIVYEDMDPKPSFDNPVAIYPESSQGNVLKEYLIPIEFLPTNEGFKEIKIYPKFIDNGKDLNLVSFNYIRGTGILPAIEVMGVYFNGKTLVNTFNKDTGYVTIYSRSKYADLYIKSIKVIKQNEQSNDFMWLNTNFPKDTILKRMTSIKFPILFKPEESGERSITIQVISDAVKGNQSNWDTTYAVIRGFGYNRILSVEPLNFKDVAYCDSSSGKLVIRNISDSITTEIYEILFETNDINPFEIDKSIFLSKNIILTPGDSIAFDVKFKPFLDNKFDYSVMTRVLSDDDTSTTFIRGNAQKYNIYIYSDTLMNSMPGIMTLDKEPNFVGKNYNINLYSSNWANSAIDSIYLEIVYPKSNFKFVNYIEKGTIIKDWNISFTDSELSRDTNIIKILCYGLNPIVNNGILITPAFMIMLGDTNGIKYSIQNVNFYSKEHCSKPIISNGYIDLSYCGEELRKIQISSHLYGITIINSNPTSDHNLLIAYNVALDATTKIEVFDQFGNKVIYQDKGIVAKGRYFDNLNISDLSSGVYFLNFVSGPYSKIEKFIINR